MFNKLTLNVANVTVIVKRFTLSVTADATVIVNALTLCVRTKTVLLTRYHYTLKLTFRVFKFNNVFTIYINITIYLYD